MEKYDRDRISYWAKRFREDCSKLEDNKKISLVKSFLQYSIPLQKDEADFFMDENPDSKDMDKLVRYSGIEAKIETAFNSTFNSSSGLFNNPGAIENFWDDFRKILTGFYTKEELDEIASFAYNDDVGLIVMDLAGPDDYFRKIRNAYLPGMTDFIGIDLSGGGSVNYTLFDGKEDAVSQIERILGINKQKEKKDQN